MYVRNCSNQSLHIFCFQMQNNCFELSVTRLEFCHKFTSSWLGKNSSYLFKNISRILVFWIQTTFMNCFNNMSFCSGLPAWSAFHLFEDERTHLLNQTNKKKRLSNYFWSGGEKKVSKDVPGFTCNWWVCLSNENVWFWWGLQLVQPGRSKTLYGLHGLQPGQKNGARSAPVPGVTSVGVCSISAGEMRFILSQGCLEEAERLHCSGTSF